MKTVDEKTEYRIVYSVFTDKKGEYYYAQSKRNKGDKLQMITSDVDYAFELCKKKNNKAG